MGLELNQGCYTIPEADRSIGSTAMGPVFERDFDNTAMVSFHDLIELAFIRDFREAGLSMQLIRKAASQAQALWSEKHPFAIKRFETDGKRIFYAALQEDGAPKMVELLTHQHVFERIVRRFIKQPVGVIADAARGGNSARTIAHWFELKPREVKDALEFAQERRLRAA